VSRPDDDWSVSGLSAAGLGHVLWRRSWRGDSSGGRIAFGILPERRVGFHDSDHPGMPLLVFGDGDIGLWSAALTSGPPVDVLCPRPPGSTQG
jgi:hypothetical protein